MNERRWNLFLACLLATVGLIGAGLLGGTYWSLVAMSAATIGFYGSKGSFWSLPKIFLSGTAAASGIAWINALGNLGGFFGPYAVGWIKDSTGSFENGLYALAGSALMAAILTVVGVQAPRRRIAPAGLGITA